MNVIRQHSPYMSTALFAHSGLTTRLLSAETISAADQTPPPAPGTAIEVLVQGLLPLSTLTVTATTGTTGLRLKSELQSHPLNTRERWTVHKLKIGGREI